MLSELLKFPVEECLDELLRKLAIKYQRNFCRNSWKKKISAITFEVFQKELLVIISEEFPKDRQKKKTAGVLPRLIPGINSDITARNSYRNFWESCLRKLWRISWRYYPRTFAGPSEEIFQIRKIILMIVFELIHRELIAEGL